MAMILRADLRGNAASVCGSEEASDETALP